MIAFNLSAYGDAEALRSVGESLRSDRLSHNFTQQHVANLAGISLPTYRKLEQGEGTVELRHFARVLGVLGHVDRLRELIPPVPIPPDRKALANLERQRARQPAKPAS
jgi:transcriptional regulator with XRE-family HTH domain